MTDAVTRSRLTGDRCPQIEATAPAEEQQRSTVPVWLQGVVLLVHLLPLGLAAGTLVEDAEVVHSLPLVLLALTTLLGLTAGIHQLILRPLCQEAEAREQAQPIGQSRWEEARAATAGVGFTTAFAVAGSAVAVVAIFPLLLGESSTYPLPFLGIGVLSVLPRLTAASQCGAPLPSWSLLVLGASFITLLDEMLAPPARLTAKTNAELKKKAAEKKAADEKAAAKAVTDKQKAAAKAKADKEKAVQKEKADKEAAKAKATAEVKEPTCHSSPPCSQLDVMHALLTAAPHAHPRCSPSHVLSLCTKGE